MRVTASVISSSSSAITSIRLRSMAKSNRDLARKLLLESRVLPVAVLKRFRSENHLRCPVIALQPPAASRALPRACCGAVSSLLSSTNGLGSR
jgi:hypothetical protein